MYANVSKGCRRKFWFTILRLAQAGRIHTIFIKSLRVLHLILPQSQIALFIQDVWLTMLYKALALMCTSM